MNNTVTHWPSEMLGLIEWAATWWLQATILLTIGLLAANLLRRPAWQSLVLRTTIASVLLSPMLAQLLSFTGWPVLTLDMHSGLLSQPDTTMGLPLFAESQASRREDAGTTVDQPPSTAEHTKLQSPHTELIVTAVDGGKVLPNEVDPRTFAPSHPIASAVLPPTISVESAASSLGRQLSAYRWILMIVWVAGTTALLAQLLQDIAGGQLLKRQSGVADAQCAAVCCRVAKQLRLRRHPDVLINPFLSSPCLVGHWRPSILLPEDIDPASYEQVFLHELAHLHRGDWLWCGVGRVARALLWCQPLIWWLHRQNLSVAEEICDDYVIQHGCSREFYLQQLIQIAERSLPVGRPVGVSMVGLRSNLGRRAVRIVDTTRSLSTEAGRVFVASAVFSFLSLTLCVALIEVGQSGSAIAVAQDGSSPQTSTTSANSTTEDSQPSNTAATNSADEEQSNSGTSNNGESSFKALRTYHGTVLDANGNPVAGATVSAVSRKFSADENRWRDLEPLATTVSAADGTYMLTYSVEGNHDSYFLMATLDGYAPDGVGMVTLQELHRQKNNSQLNLRLAKQKSIEGRIVDMEGNAVSHVKVEIVSVFLPTSDGAVEQWIANAKPDLLKWNDNYVMMNHDPRVTETKFPGRSDLDGAVFNSGVVETDAHGKFQLAGIGENSLVHARLSGPTIAMRDALIVARDMTSLLAFNYQVRNNDFTHYGAQPTIVVGSSQPITGLVVDADSGEPLKDFSVVLTRIGKSNWHINKISTTTDHTGHFQLSGAPIGGGHMLEVQPGLEQPYFKTQLELPVTPSSKPLDCKFELKKTKWITGRITNEAGDPVVAFLNYYPYRDNIHAENYSNFEQRITGRAPSEEVRSDSDGRFRIKAIPGPAVLGACVANHEDQPKYIPNRAEGLLERIGGEQMSKMFDSWSANYFDAMVEIDIDPAVDEVSQDLNFMYGLTRELRVVDADGAAMQTVAVLGTTFPPRYNQDHKLGDSKLEIIGLQPDEKRMLVLMSPDSGSGKMITIHATDSEVTEVHLEPCATVTGLVLDQDAQPVANLQVHISPMQEPEQDNWSRELGPVVTDAKGKFQLKLAFGGLYRLWAYTSMGPNFNVTLRPAAGATYQLGELTDGLELTEQDAAKFLLSSNP